MEHEGDGDTNCGTWKGTRKLGNKRISGNHPNYRIIKIGQNTEKSPDVKENLIGIKEKIAPSCHWLLKGKNRGS